MRIRFALPPLLAAILLLAGCRSVPQPDWPDVIGKEGYADRPDLIRADFPDSVTEIGPVAFAGCPNLREVTIPASVTVLGTAPFDDTPLARFAVAPENPVCRSDDAGALLSKDGTVLLRAPGRVSAYVVPDTVTEVAYGAFSGLTELKSVDLPGGLLTLGPRAFAGCSALESLVLPPRVGSIGQFAFAYCPRLTIVSLGGAFRKEGGMLLTADGTTVIRGNASLTVARVPEGVSTIAEGAFSGCHNLVEADLPSTLEYLCAEAFADCPKLRVVRFRSRQPEWFVPGSLAAGGPEPVRVIHPGRPVWHAYPWEKLGPTLRPETE